MLVTPDGERTMNTYLGAAQDLHPNDIDADAIAAPQIIYLEGYLWDPPHAKEAFLKAAKIAHGAGRDVALTLSDAFCVDRYRAEFLDLIRNGTVDLVFANERELHSLYETADFDTARQCAAQRCEARRDHAQREGLPGRDARRDRSGAGEPDRARGRCDRRGRSVCGGFSGRARRAAPTIAPRRGSARSPPPR